MELFITLIIGLGCLAYDVIVGKNILFAILESENGKLNWKKFRKDISWIGLIFLGVSFLAIGGIGIWKIIQLFTKF